MERLKLVNVLKTTFLGSEFHMFTVGSLKYAALTLDTRIFFTNISV